MIWGLLLLLAGATGAPTNHHDGFLGFERRSSGAKSEPKCCRCFRDTLRTGKLWHTPKTREICFAETVRGKPCENACGYFTGPAGDWASTKRIKNHGDYKWYLNCAIVMPLVAESWKETRGPLPFCKL